MADKDRLFREVELPRIFSFDDVRTEASEILADRTESGRYYAVLTFLQSYCKPINVPDVEWDEFRQGDPRKSKHLDKVRNVWRFCLMEQANHDNKINQPVRRTTSRYSQAISDDWLVRDEFLRCANDFVQWLRDGLERLPFEHGYKWVKGCRKCGLRKGSLFTAGSLWEAFRKYHWPSSCGCGYRETAIYLGDLAQRLKRALAASNQNVLAVLILEVLSWGGVAHRQYVASTWKYLIDTDKQKLVLSVHAQVTLLKDILNTGVWPRNRKILSQIQIDSGTTKVFSLLIDGFIIYDGRVASALAYLVRKWAEEKQRQPNGVPRLSSYIPDCLRFSRATESKRDPNPPEEDLFPKMSNGPQRLRENIYASWLLQAVLANDTRSGFVSLEEDERLRALEAALFMLGYCLTPSEVQASA
ncbi:MAG: hypothetical protein D6694_00540 [Gammaproteobacteria bacterium]|nr:MAG: hypothetical protein D6694_00540 [Gammaproteobacteria bacterium]